MKLALISCAVLNRDINYCIYNSKNVVHSFWLEQGLHDIPKTLHELLCEKIKEIEKLNENFSDDKKFDAILIGYGLCSNSILNIEAINLPLVIPKCDDCIALFLGSQKKYLELFNSHKGIYWFNKTWVEHAFIPSEENYKKLYDKYVIEFDEDNAEFLIEQETSFTRNYENTFFIKSAIYDDYEEREFIKGNAKYFNWKYKEIDSDISLLKKFIDGDWDENFLICEKGYKIAPDYSEQKILAEKL